MQRNATQRNATQRNTTQHNATQQHNTTKTISIRLSSPQFFFSFPFRSAHTPAIYREVRCAVQNTAAIIDHCKYVYLIRPAASRPVVYSHDVAPSKSEPACQQHTGQTIIRSHFLRQSVTPRTEGKERPGRCCGERWFRRGACCTSPRSRLSCLVGK